ncbi:MAG: sn-glycerol-3-phosphate ABC transporter ATP-binding protein UgpC [Desulfobacterales bacterium]|nr:sn-glycerol-3-phosphate ABC transporter ATP-binding protein UgpC [Desulfobacterales bacterium]
MASLKIQNVCKSFGAVDVLKGIDLEIESGEFLVLVGPSGCGKSTLLNLIAGLETVTSGDVLIGDRVVNAVSPKDRDIAMVFQSYALYPNMNVRKNLSFGLETRKVAKPEIDATIERVAQMLQITDLLDRKPAQLSGGQRQRVAMGRALARNPKIFLFDEPLSNLDAKLRVEMRTEIKRLHQRIHTTIVYVTHDQIEAMTLADRVVVMKQGIVQQVGTPTEIYDTPANTFVASFIGSPAMNLMQGEIEGGTFRGTNVEIAGLSAADGPVTLGFRAEDAAVADTSADIKAPIYTIELLGDATMLTVRAGGEMVSVKAAKDFRAEIGDAVSISVPVGVCHLFDHESGERLAS